MRQFIINVVFKSTGIAKIAEDVKQFYGFDPTAHPFHDLPLKQWLTITSVWINFLQDPYTKKRSGKFKSKNPDYRPSFVDFLVFFGDHKQPVAQLKRLDALFQATTNGLAPDSCIIESTLNAATPLIDILKELKNRKHTVPVYLLQTEVIMCGLFFSERFNTSTKVTLIKDKDTVSFLTNFIEYLQQNPKHYKILQEAFRSAEKTEILSYIFPPQNTFHPPMWDEAIVEHQFNLLHKAFSAYDKEPLVLKIIGDFIHQ